MIVSGVTQIASLPLLEHKYVRYEHEMTMTMKVETKSVVTAFE
jgi:hypothetical protein